MWADGGHQKDVYNKNVSLSVLAVRYPVHEIVVGNNNGQVSGKAQKSTEEDCP